MQELMRGTKNFHIDPLQVASTIAGATLFFVAAMPMIARRRGFDPVDAMQIAAHKTELVRIARLLLHFDSD